MKKIICFMLTILISILLILLSFSFCLKNVVITTLNSEIVSNEISSKISSYLKKEGVSYEYLENIEKNILNSSSTNEITKKYFENIINSIINQSEIIIPNTKEDILSLINENEKYIKDSGIELNDNEKKALASKISGNEELGKIYRNITSNVKDKLTEKEVKYITLYSKIITDEFKIITIVLIVILLILIGLIKKSFYKWSINLSIALLISGILILLVLPAFTDFVINDMLQNIGNYKVNLNYLTNFGYIYIGLFGVFILIYIVLQKIIMNNESKYEY